MKKINYKNLLLGGFLILLLLYQFVCAPGIRKIKDLNKTYIQKQKELETLNNLISQYKARTTQSTTLFAPSNFNLYLFVSKSIDMIDSKSRISRITPVTESILLNAIEQHITIGIEEIELEKLLMLLDEIEKRDFLRFGYLQISRNAQKPFVVKAEMEIISYKSVQ